MCPVRPGQGQSSRKPHCSPSLFPKATQFVNIAPFLMGTWDPHPARLWSSFSLGAFLPFFWSNPWGIGFLVATEPCSQHPPGIFVPISMDPGLTLAPSLPRQYMNRKGGFNRPLDFIA